MKEFEFKQSDKVLHEKWAFDKCPILKDPADWASSKFTFFSSKKKEMIRGFYFHYTHKMHECLTLNLNKEQDKLACLNFRHILCYSGDKPTPYPSMSAVEVILLGLRREDLRDEIYAQILK